MKKKILFLSAILLILVISVAGILIWISLPGNQEMPALTFVYFSENQDVYLMDSEGFVYVIREKTNKMANNKWIKETEDALKNHRSEDWLEQIGKTEKKTLQKQYKVFYNVVSNPKFEIHPTVNEIPDVEPNTQYTRPRERWYGYYVDEEGGQLKEFYLVGYLEYEASDERARQIADWVKKEVLKGK